MLEPKAWVTHASGGSTSRDQRFRDFASYRSGKHFIARWGAVLAQAPAADAPLKQLCEPSLAGPGRWPGRRPTSTTRPRAPARPSRSAGHTRSGSDSSWMSRRRASSSSATCARPTPSASGQLTEEAGHLRNRLDDLESRGLLGMIRWRIGMFFRRRDARKKIGELHS